MVGQSLGNSGGKELDLKVLGENDPRTVCFSQAYALSLTRTCRNDCPYCGYHKRDELIVPYSTIKVTKNSRLKGSRELLIVSGERPDEASQIRSTLDLWGFPSYIDYVYTVAELGFLEGLIPTVQLGFLLPQELKKIGEISAMVRIMIDSVDDSKVAEIYPKSPGKRREIRLRLIEWASKLGIPVSTGVLVGIGETKEHRRETLQAISQLNRQYGMVQEVVIQQFYPEAGTRFATHGTPSHTVMLQTAEMALQILSNQIRVVVPYTGLPTFKDFLDAGIRDIGTVSEGVRVIQAKVPPINSHDIAVQLDQWGFQLQQRFPIGLDFIRDGKFSKKLGQVFDAQRYKIKKDEQEKLKLLR